VPWGQGAFGAYLDARTRSMPPAEYLEHDASHLLQGSSAPAGSLHMLVDVGTADQFLAAGQLTPEALERAAEDRGAKGELELRRQEGYDHSYYFVSKAWVGDRVQADDLQISTFSPEHVAYHAKHLKA
jgi:S-formylglutathione hydrolase